MKTIDILKTFLRKHAELIKKIYPHPEWKYNSYEELILKCGRQMNFAPLPEGIEPGLPKGCYYNCLQLLAEHPELIYCEGYALADGLVLPVPHAWLINSVEEVIDPTWDTNGAYIGIPFNTDWVISLFEFRNPEDYLSVFENNHQENFSLLTEGLPDDATTRITLTVLD